MMNHWSTPLHYQGNLYGIFGFKEYGKAPLQCIDLQTGTIKWSKEGFGPGNLIRVGSTLVVLSDKGEIVTLDANPAKYTELERRKVLDGKCWSTPTLSNQYLLVRSTKEAAALMLKD
jgi:outer membrane protein assembly factor BamB